jgi:F0F1-type ATP synthase membrane subunit c/vacuolar-type H+-ATPase subunit K
MRILNFICGVCVLFATLAYGHILHHHFMHSADDGRSLLFWALFLLAAAVGFFSLIGGFLLLKRPR